MADNPPSVSCITPHEIFGPEFLSCGRPQLFTVGATDEAKFAESPHPILRDVREHGLDESSHGQAAVPYSLSPCLTTQRDRNRQHQQKYREKEKV